MKPLPYQFVVLRYTHKVTRGEFANFGVLMWLPQERRLIFRVNEHYAPLSGFFRDFDGTAFQRTVRGLERKIETVASQVGSPDRDLFKEEPKRLGEFLQWIVPESETSFGASSVMAGVHPQPEVRLAELMDEMVEHPSEEPRDREDEGTIADRMEASLRKAGLGSKMRSEVELSHGEFSHVFRRAWSNGRLQLLEPISFDYLEKSKILDKANTWNGRLSLLSKGGVDFRVTGVVARPRQKKLERAYGEALTFLGQSDRVRKLVEQDNVDSLIPTIAKEIAHRSA